MQHKISTSGLLSIFLNICPCIPPCLYWKYFHFVVFVMAGLRRVAIWFSGEWKARVSGVNVLEGEGPLRQRQQSVLSDRRICEWGESRRGLHPPPPLALVLAIDGSDGQNGSMCWSGFMLNVKWHVLWNTVLDHYMRSKFCLLCM